MKVSSEHLTAYRAYRFGSRGHVESVMLIEAASEGDAVDKARRIADGYAVELWQHDRFIARFKPGQR